MALAYTKDFLVDAFLSRYMECSLISIEQFENLEKMANAFYDEVGKNKFREYCALDADAIKQYKLSM